MYTVCQFAMVSSVVVDSDNQKATFVTRASPAAVC